MQIGVLATGDIAVRAAHSLAAHPGVDEVVVIGPARSSTFRVAPTAEGCDYLLGSGPRALEMARPTAIPLLWDGGSNEPGVLIWGGSPVGLALALGEQVSDPQLIALAHPDVETQGDREVLFPHPVGPVQTGERMIDGHLLAAGKSDGGFAACYVKSAGQHLTITDDARFMSGVALAATFALVEKGPTAVWDESFPYLTTAIDMGLLMGET